MEDSSNTGPLFLSQLAIGGRLLPCDDLRVERVEYRQMYLPHVVRPIRSLPVLRTAETPGTDARSEAATVVPPTVCELCPGIPLHSVDGTVILEGEGQEPGPAEAQESVGLSVTELLER